ncbi:UNVERIFIED_CONTAM: (-)-isopiperitenone reductase [Sesamum calycinum]|uniref:(-)-isopiperitenone reductase n=1 Tax=Sesamum calycinum TaxID=2727403 RepID=A0AAW2T0C1_9LAMI
MGVEESTVQQPSQDTTSDSIEALLEAARYDDIDDVKSIASTALHMASANGHVHIVDYLINNGVNVNACNMEKNTPLHWACLNGQIEVVKRLILAGANISLLNSHERTPMDEAISRGKMDVVDAINEAAAQVQGTTILTTKKLFTSPQSNQTTQKMAEPFVINPATQRYAVVTGANKGIGFEICRHLASEGIMVISTARNEKRGTEAQERLKEIGLSDNVVFHQLDVLDPASIAFLVDFIKAKYGRLDILVNNAGISGIGLDGDVLILQETIERDGRSLLPGGKPELVQPKASGTIFQTLEDAEQCVETNYYGAKRVTEALIPLLKLSDAPRIVNVSSTLGNLRVNNAGIAGVGLDGDTLILQEIIDGDIASVFADGKLEPVQLKANGTLTETLEGAEECIRTNYYGAKRVTEALIPLLQLSDSPRIVNVSSILGNLRLLCNEWAKGVLSNQESLTEEKVDEVVQEFLKNFKEGALQANDWPTQIAAYKVSKAALNAYTRIMARKYPSFCINCVCPGFARTDITCNLGPLSASEAAESPVRLALLPDGGPSGSYFYRKEIISF